MQEFNYYDHLKNVKQEILERFIEQLEEIEEPKEIYFHDIIHEVVDGNIPYNNVDLISIIEESGNESEVEECLLDISRGLQGGVLMPMAFECLNIALFEDKLFMDLQDKLNNETISKTKAKKIIKQIKENMN